MSDEPNDDTNDPLQTNQVIEEAFEVSDDEAVSESEEGANVEALSRSFESYVRNYQDTWQQAWLDSIAAYEQDVENWQLQIANDYGGDPLLQPVKQTVPPPQAAKAATKTAKSKPQKTRS